MALIAKYTCNTSGVLPTFNTAFTGYTHTEVDNENGTYSVEINADILPTSISFNSKSQLLNVEYINTSNITSMVNMFNGCTNLSSLDVSDWDTSQVTNMQYMFYACYSLQSLDVSDWDTSKVASMQYMFQGCNNLTSLDVSGWDTSQVINMQNMFGYCTSLTSLDLSGWDTSKVIIMVNVFGNCTNLTSIEGIEDRDTSQVTNMGYMFQNCSNLTSLDLSGWDTSKVITMSNMFDSCSGLQSLDVSGWDTSEVTTMYGMFQRCSSLTSIEGIEDWDTSQVTNMETMFNGCSSLQSLDASGWDTSKVTTMSSMFNGCSSLQSLDLSEWDTSQVTAMSNMFYVCSNLTSLNVSGWDTSQVTTMISMFNGCSGLVEIKGLENFKGVVHSISTMFNNCSKLEEINLGNLVIDSGETSGIFSGCTNLKIVDISNIKNIGNSAYLFNNTNKLTDIGLLYVTQSCVENILRQMVTTAIPTLWVKDLDASQIQVPTNKKVTIKNYEEEITEFALPTQLGIDDRLYWDKDKGKYFIEKDSRLVETDMTTRLSVKTHTPSMSVTCYGDIQASNIKATIPFRDVDEDYVFDESHELDYIKQSFELRFPDEDDVPEGWGFMGVGEEGTGLKALIDWVDGCTDEEFVRDFEQHFHKDYTFRYYLLVITLGMVDNLGKNMMFDTWDNKIFMPRFYDCDTICSYDNSGQLKFDVDIEMEQGYWNTSSSRLWTRIRDLFHDELVEKYNNMRQNGLSYESLMKCFYDEQIAKIPQKYYNMDYDVKYAPFADSYIGMANGDVYEHAKRWIKNRLIFVDTLFDYAPSYNNDVLTIRANTTEPMTLYIETYTPVYQHLSWYNNQMDKKKIDGKIAVSFTGTAMAATDQEVLIYGGSNIKKISGISSMNPNRMLIGSATRLIELDAPNCPLLADINSNKANLAPHTYLNKLNLNNCPLLGGNLIINNSPLIREIDIQGTAITGLNLPGNVRNLEVMKLPATIPNLTLNDAGQLHTLEFAEGTVLQSVSMTNCNALVNTVNFDIKNATSLTLNNSYNAVDELYLRDNANVSLSNLPNLERIIFTPNDEYEIFDKGYLVTRPDYKVTIFNSPKCNEFIVTAPQRLSYGLEDGQINPNTVFSANSLDLSETYFTDIKLLSTTDVNTLKLPRTVKNFIADSAYDIDTNVIEDASYEVIHEELIQQYTEEWNEEVKIGKSRSKSYTMDETIDGEYLEVVPNSQLVVSPTEYINNMAIFYYDSDKTQLGYLRGYNDGISTPTSYTISSDARYIKVSTRATYTDGRGFILTYETFEVPNISPSSSDGSVIYSINSEQEGVWNLDGLELDNFYTYGMNNDVKDNKVRELYDFHEVEGSLDWFTNRMLITEDNCKLHFRIDARGYWSWINITVYYKNGDSHKVAQSSIDGMIYDETIDFSSYIGNTFDVALYGTFAQAVNDSNYLVENMAMKSLTMPKKDPNYKVTIENANIKPKELPTMLYPKFINTDSPIKGEVDYSEYEGSSLDWAFAYMNEDEVDASITDEVMLNTDINRQYNMIKDSEYVIRDPRTICVMTVSQSGLTPYMLKGYNSFTNYARTEVDNGNETYTVTILSNDINDRPTQIGFSKNNGIGEKLLSLDYINTKDITVMTNMFYNCTSLTSLNTSGWNTENVTSMSSMFHTCSNLQSLDVSGWDTSQVTSTNAMFTNCSGLTSIQGIEEWNTENVTSMSSMFQNCSNLTSLDLSGWTTGKVTTMNDMFNGCTNLTSIEGIEDWDTSKVINMQYMFYACSSLQSLDVSGWDTSQVITMYSIFQRCSNLTSLDVSDWDTSKVTTMSNMFNGCSGLQSLDVSSWDTSEVTDIFYTFQGCSKLISLDVSDWDTSQVTNMYGAFQYCTSLQSLDVSGWDTSKVTGMQYMFFGCTSLQSLDVSDWDTSQVTNMYYMFTSCSGLTSIEGIEDWDTSAVTNIQNMFGNCTSLTSLDLSGWDNSQVTNMSSMFGSCSNLTSIEGIEDWDTSQVTNMSYMFQNCSNLTSIDVSDWDTSQVTSMRDMFNGCTSLTSIDLSNFNLSNVADLGGMFRGCTNLTQIIGTEKWNVSDKCASLWYLFQGCSKLTNLNLSGWDISNVTDTTCMFLTYSNSLSEIIMENWTETNIEKIVPELPTKSSDSKGTIITRAVSETLKSSLAIKYWDMVNGLLIARYTATNSDAVPTFNEGEEYEYDKYSTDLGEGKYEITLASWDDFTRCQFNSITDLYSVEYLKVTSQVTNMQNMFQNCTALISVNCRDWDTSQVTSMYYTFNSCASLTSLDLSNWDTSQVTNMYGMFQYCRALTSLDLSGFDTGQVTIMYGMFNNCSNLQSLDLSDWDTSKVTTMRNMFYNCSNLQSLDLSEWDTSKVTTMQNMFQDCSSLTSIQGIEDWDTGEVTSMSNMFTSCSNLTNLDVSNWKVEKVTSMSYMFQDCTSLTSLDLSNWKTEKVTNMDGMFQNCSSLQSLDVSSWDNSQVINMYGMFQYCSGLQSLDLSDWGTSQVINMNGMFRGCTNLKTLDISGWDVGKVTDPSNMFNACSNLETIIGIEELQFNSATNIYAMFYNCQKLTSLDLSSWNTSTMNNMGLLFSGCSGLTSLNLSSWDITNVNAMGFMFQNCRALTTLNIIGWIVNTTTQEAINSLPLGTGINKIIGSVTEGGFIIPSGWIYECNNPYEIAKYTANATGVVPSFNSEYTGYTVAEVNSNGIYTVSISTNNLDDLPTSISFMSKAELLTVEKLNISNITSMVNMFNGCSNLTSINSSDWDVNKVTNMEYMFDSCSSLTELNISDWNTESVTSMAGMFRYCSKLTSLDLSNWNTDSAIRMNNMFIGCSSLTSLDLSNFNTTNVIDMYGMFNRCSGLTSLNLSTWNITNADMGYMFSRCSSLTTLNVIGWIANTATQNGISSLPAGTGINKIYASDSFTVPSGWTLEISQPQLLALINDLEETEDGVLVLGENNIAKLTDEEIAIAVNKGWTVE